MTNANLDFLSTLENIIVERKTSPPEGSYTAQLFAAGTQRIAQKVGEEAIEVALAACIRDREQTIGESADLIYHLLVLLANEEIRLADVVATLRARHSG